MSLADKLRTERIERLHALCLDLAHKTRDGPLYHFAYRSESEPIMDLLQRRVPRDRTRWPVTDEMRQRAKWLASEYKEEPKQFLWKEYLGRLGDDRQRLMSAVPLFWRDVDLHVEWHIVCDRNFTSGGETPQLSVAGVLWVDEFRESMVAATIARMVEHVACEAISDLVTDHQTDRTYQWLSILYDVVGYGRRRVTSTEMRHLEPENRLRPDEFIDVIWLRSDFYTASARAIGILAERLSQPATGAQSAVPRVSTDVAPILSEAERRIIDVIRDAAHRLTTQRILAELESRFGAASIGTTKQNLANLVRRSLLTNRQDVIPKGYGLAEWG